MVSFLFSVHLAASVSALGLNTDEWSSPAPAMVAQVQALADAIASTSKGEQPKVTLQQSIDEIRKLADAGDKDALFAMGLFLQQTNQQGSLEQAMEFYKKAADKGQLHAMNNYGFLVAASTQDPAKAKEGIASIKAASDKGFNPARRNMAAILLGGMAGEAKDVDGAQKLLEAAANAKDAQAQFELAQFHLGNGGDDKRDDEKGWDLMTKAADAGNPNALSTVGAVLFEGGKVGAKEIPANPQQAVEKFTKLAEQGVPAGLRTMAELHENGLGGVPKDFQKALGYFVRAAQGNDTVAQLRLAGFYDLGVDLDPKDEKVEVVPNPAAALELYKLAAQSGAPLALYNVGTFYETGRAVDRDLQKSFAFFLQAAVSGFVPAMQKAGFYYLNGAGTLKDPIAATGWFTRTAAAGLPEGMLSLGLMAENGLFMGSADNTPFRTSADQYQKAADSPGASQAVVMEALLRLGSLHARGVMVAPNSPVQPDPEQAYVFFKQAVDLAPDNASLKQILDDTAGKLSPAQITKANATAEQMVKDRAAKRETAAAAAATKPAAATTPAGAAAGAPEAQPTTPATPPAPEKKPGGFRLPGIGR